MSSRPTAPAAGGSAAGPPRLPEARTRERAPHRLRRGLFVLAATLVLVDGAISLFLIDGGLFLGHPLPPFGALPHPAQNAWLEELGSEQADGIGRFDAKLGWSWRPSAGDGDGKFTTNSIGARGPREYPPTPPAGTRRLLFFGDSFTFGDEIPDSASFESILESRYRGFEAINFGVSGYGTDQAWLRYREVGKELQPDAVFIGIMLENIGRNVNRYRPLWNTRTGFCGAKPRFYFAADGALQLAEQPFRTRQDLRTALLEDRLIERIAEHEYWLDRPRIWTGKVSSIMRILGLVLAETERRPSSLWQDTEGEPFRVTLAVLEGFHREALADGARVAPVVIFPPRTALHDHALRDRSYWKPLLDELDRRSIPYIDVIPALAKRQRELDEQEASMTLYYGGHLTSVGNSVVADEIHAWLETHLAD